MIEQQTSSDSPELKPKPGPAPGKLTRHSTIAKIRSNFKLEKPSFKSASNLGNFFNFSKKKMSTDVIHEQGYPENSTPVKSTEDIFNMKYEAGETIGQGSSGVVKLIKRKKDDKQFVAKIIRVRDTEYYDQVKKEFEIHSELDHQNIAKAEELIISELDDKAFIIMEYCPGDTLKTLIQKKGSLDQFELRYIMTKILKAIKHMHDKKICHRDIKPSNIIIQDTGKTKNDKKKVVKLIDFSISTRFGLKKVTKGNNKVLSLDDTNTLGLGGMMLTNTGTNEYKAPEIVLGAPYDQKVDIWSLGVLLYYAASGIKPFQGATLAELYQSITEAKVRFKGDIWKERSDMMKTYIVGCLTKTSFMRMTPEQALSHPWIKGWGFVRKSFSNMASFFDVDDSPEEKDAKTVQMKSSLFQRATPMKKTLSDYLEMDEDLQDQFNKLNNDQILFQGLNTNKS